MASKNQVNLTFAGDSSDLEKAFDNVGASAKTMSTDVGGASRDVGAGIDTTGSKAGDLESGFRGVTDSMSGFAQIAQGDVLGGLTDLAGGVEALATGFSGVLVPALKRSVSWLGRTKIGMFASAAATKAMAVAQRILNAVMRANPIGIIITVLAALGAAIVVAWKKSETFRNVVRGAMRGITTAFGWVLDRGRDVLNWFRELPGKIGRFFSGIGNAIAAPFRAAFQGIRNIWNSTVGGRGFTVPSWVPGIGGREFRIPTLHQGGIVPGAPGQESLALLQAGERVSRAGSTQQSTGNLTLSVATGADSAFARFLHGEIRKGTIKLSAGGQPVRVA